MIFKNPFSLDKLFKILIILIMSYQLIDLTLKYRQYKTIIKSELKYFEFGDLPSITLCRDDHNWHFERKYRVDHEIFYTFAYDNHKWTSTNDKSKKQTWNLT